MRIALLSDIHGNLLALDAVLGDLRQHGPYDQIVVAGDLVWSGPWPAEVVDRVQGIGAAVIQGNTDAFFLRQPGASPFGKDEDRFTAHLKWMMDRLGPERVAYLTDLPFSHRVSPAPGHDLLVVHANPVDVNQALTPYMADADYDEMLLDEGGREPDWQALAFGHLHVPFTRRWRGRLLVNVASAGLSMDGDQRATYAVLAWNGQDWHAEHHRVYYPVPVVAREMRTSGMPRGKHFAERLVAASYGRPLQVLALAAES